MDNTKLVGLVDCNNFFVSCERLFRPDLAAAPTLVLSANDGCVVARSQEVKDLHIPMGVPYFKIKDIVKDNGIEVFSGNLTLYRDISRRIFSIICDEFTEVEQYSIDEAFFLVENDSHLKDKLQLVRSRVLTEVGMPVSIGVASSKTLAKISTDIAKNCTGTFVLSESDWKDRSSNFPLASIWGVGRRTAESLTRNGIRFVQDYIDLPTFFVRQHYGVVGERLQSELKGEYVYAVDKKRPLQKSLMSSRSFSHKTEDINVLADALAYHVRSVTADLRGMDAGAKNLRVSLRTSRHGDYFIRGGSLETVFASYTSDTFVLLKEAQKLLHKLYEDNVPYNKIGVTVSDIQSCSVSQQSLFGGSKPVDNNSLLKVIDGLNKQSDKELLVLGSHLRSKTWQSKSAKKSQSYTTSWSDLPRVSAN